MPKYLQWKNTVIIPPNQCRQLLGDRANRMHPQTICTRSSQGQGACVHDEGGPLTLPDGTAIGVVSTPGCGLRPDTFFKLWHGIPFIRSVTQNQIPNMPQGPRQ